MPGRIPAKTFPAGWSLEMRNEDDGLVEFMDLGGLDFSDPAVVAGFVEWIRGRQNLVSKGGD